MPGEIFIKKIQDRSATVAVIGLGYVGLPLVIRYAEEGYKVTGFDVDKTKVDSLTSGQSYIEHIESALIKTHVDSGRFKATTEMAGLKDADAIIICVPTPLTEDRKPDMSYVVGTSETIAKYLRKGQLVSLESTTYPGTTEEVVRPLLEKSGLTAGTDFLLVYSPEREDPGREDFTTKTIPKVVGGVDAASLEAGSSLYSAVVDTVVPVSSTGAAEMTKLLENIYRCVNIALVNELKMLTEKMGIDIWEVIKASSTKPFGFEPFYPGPGLGGHCIPIDPFYLSWKAREYDFETRFIELAGEINAAMPEYVVGKIHDALVKRGQALSGSRILILGAAYKKDVDDMRESPSVHIIEILKGEGAVVDYNDPHVPELPKMRGHSLEMKSVELTDESLASYDCVVIVTDHSAYDYRWIVEKSRLVVDSRGAMVDIASDKIVRA